MNERFPSSYNITKISNKDFYKIKQIFLSALENDPNSFSLDFYEVLNNDENWWRDYLKEFLKGEKYEYYTLEDDSRIIYAGCGLIYTNNIASIVWMYVNPNYRRMGIGSSLLNRLENIAKNKRCNKLILNVVNNEQGIFEFYQKKGFEITKKIPSAFIFRGRVKGIVEMKKELSSK